jgi:two-component system, NtrC family, nitrogen regulation sensor histidine kinase NtrY
MNTIREASRPTLPARREAPRPSTERRPFRDNPRLILLGILVLIAALILMVRLADRSTELNPDFLSEVVLYALSAADLTMLVALVFVLARNIVKLVVERRRGLPFSRFRAKLVLAMLGLTVVPSVLVLIVGSELIRSSTEKWFSAPIDEVLTAATRIAQDYYRDRESSVSSHATRLARELPATAVEAGDLDAVKRLIEVEVAQGRLGLVEVYRARPRTAARPETVSLLYSAESPGLPLRRSSASSDRLASIIANGGSEPYSPEPLDGGGELVRAGAPVRDASGKVIGVVLASDYLSGEAATHARQIIAAYQNRTQLSALRRPIRGIYLTLFVMMTLMILVSATWTGLYLAKRITRPVQRLAAGAREIGAGHLDHRIEPETRDEFGSLVEAFNTMAGELAASQRKLERSRVDLERKNVQLDERRQYIETVLERIATGVISLGPDGHIETINGAALRLLEVDRDVVGLGAEQIFAREDLTPLQGLLRQGRTVGRPPAAQEIAILREGRELHLAAAATPLLRDDGSVGGAVIVFDDVTPLIRTQRVAAWRDVARRLAHEIKNPLTPIQLCAERMRRQFSSAPAPARALVEECTTTIVGEVESLKALVDEFAQFARMPAPRAVPTDLNAALGDTLALYNGLFREIKIERRFDDGMPLVRFDLEQMRRVVINLVDNAVEVLGGSNATPRPNGEAPTIVVETRHDKGNGVARILVSDNGPGIPPADRDKLFMPYYSTKQRGSGLGLAIVRRIIAEHGGSIEVADNTPSGTVFTVDLPV